MGSPEFQADDLIVSSIDAFTGSIEFGWGSQTGKFRLFAPQATDPMVMADAIDSLNAELSDMTAPLEAAKEVVVTDVELRFQHETAPDGTPWAEWSEPYAKVAEQTNVGKLRRRETERLYDAATDRASYHVVGNDLFIDTSGFPVYWAMHQYGGVITSPNMKAARRREERAAKREERAATSSGHVPARPYLGLSYDAQAAVGDIFDGWLGGEIAGFEYNYLRGGLQPRLKSGRFGKMKFS